jgi:hypothetical protein
MPRAPLKRLWIEIACAAAALCMTATANAAGISPDSYDRCKAISDDRARLLCFESLTSPGPQQDSSTPAAPSTPDSESNIPPGLLSDSKTAPSSTPIAGKWRLVHTPAPRAGRERQDIVSIMTTAELSGSDIDFAGLDLRCAEPDFEVMIFLLAPLRPQARPDITINSKKLSGAVVSPGTAIQLPREASDLARQQWLSVPNLSIEVENDGTKIHGVISLDGFNKALQTLVENCPTR